MSAVGDVIQPGESIPEDVTRVDDCAKDRWDLGKQGWSFAEGRSVYVNWPPERLVEILAPLTVTAVREPEPEPERKLIDPMHLHESPGAPCTDACYEPAEPQQSETVPVLDLVRQYGEESYQQGIAAGQRDEGGEDHYEDHYDDKARALLARIEAEVQRLRDEATHRKDRMAQLITERDEAWAKSDYWERRFGEEAARGDALAQSMLTAQSEKRSTEQRCAELHRERDEALAELAAEVEAHRATGIRHRTWIGEHYAANSCSPAQPADPGPLRLTLQRAPEGAMAVTSVKSGERHRAESEGWWKSELDGRVRRLSTLLEDGDLLVEMAPPREPRTWPKLDNSELADAPRRVRVGALYFRRITEEGTYRSETSGGLCSWWWLRAQDDVVEVDEPGGAA